MKVDTTSYRKNRVKDIDRMKKELNAGFKINHDFISESNTRLEKSINNSYQNLQGHQNHQHPTNQGIGFFTSGGNTPSRQRGSNDPMISYAKDAFENRENNLMLHRNRNPTNVNQSARNMNVKQDLDEYEKAIRNSSRPQSR